MLVYRYLQTTGSHYVTYLSNLKHYIFNYLLFQLGTFLLVILPFWIQTWPVEKIKEAMRKTDLQLYALIKDEPLLLGMNVSFCGSKFTVRNFSLPESLCTSHLRESGRAYTHWKAREKLTAKCNKYFIGKRFNFL
jgi:hypothetical protein